MAENEVDDYLAQAPEPHRSTLGELRRILRELLPEAEEGLSYGVPVFKENGKAIAGYAYFKKHCSYFPHSGSVLPGMAAELGDYEWSKGTLKFPPDRPLPKELVRRLVDVRREMLGT
jgi:uncharacterized protein YdhG (YjbR/CyaY superfamily)